MLFLLWHLNPLPEVWANWSSWTRFSTLFGLVLAGVGVYIMLLFLFGIRPSQFRLHAR